MKFHFGLSGYAEQPPDTGHADGAIPVPEQGPDDALFVREQDAMRHSNVEDAIASVQAMVLPEDRDRGYATIAEEWLKQGGSFSGTLKILSFVENQEMRDATLVRLAYLLSDQGRESDALFFVKHIEDLRRRDEVAAAMEMDIEDLS